MTHSPRSKRLIFPAGRYKIRLYLRQRTWTPLGLRNYDVYDESEQFLYTVEQQLCIPRHLCVYQPDGTRIASVKRKLFRPHQTFVLEMNGQMSVVRRSRIRKKYVLHNENWTAYGSFFAGDYRIYENESNLLAVIGDGCVGSSIQVLAPENCLPVLLFALAVQKRKRSFKI